MIIIYPDDKGAKNEFKRILTVVIFIKISKVVK